jgi:Txe/YoeB family toxin of toxin-antitoxin system
LSYQIFYTKDAAKDAEIIKKSLFYQKAKELLSIIRENPFISPPKYEKLVGTYKGLYSRRINIQHRLVYEVIESEKIIKIISMWKHYE